MSRILDHLREAAEKGKTWDDVVKALVTYMKKNHCGISEAWDSIDILFRTQDYDFVKTSDMKNYPFSPEEPPFDVKKGEFAWWSDKGGGFKYGGRELVQKFAREFYGDTSNEAWDSIEIFYPIVNSVKSEMNLLDPVDLLIADLLAEQLTITDVSLGKEKYGDTLNLTINGSPYGYVATEDYPGGTKELHRRFSKMMVFSPARALQWLKKTAILWKGSKRTGGGPAKGTEVEPAENEGVSEAKQSRDYSVLSRLEEELDNPPKQSSPHLVRVLDVLKELRGAVHTAVNLLRPKIGLPEVPSDEADAIIQVSKVAAIKIDDLQYEVEQLTKDLKGT